MDTIVSSGSSNSSFNDNWHTWRDDIMWKAHTTHFLDCLVLKYFPFLKRTIRRPDINRAIHDVIFKTLAKGQRSAFLRHKNGDGPQELTLPFLPHPLYLRPGTSDLDSFGQVFVIGSYNVLKVADISPSIVIDAGANVGMSAVYFANQFPDAHIIAIEPDPTNLAVLRCNSQAYSQIEVWHAGLASASCRLEIVNTDAAKWAIQTQKASIANSDTVPGISMLDVSAAINKQRIGLLKLDVEGAEYEIFSGGIDHWLPSVEALTVELHDWIHPDCARIVYSAVARRNFKRYRLSESDLFVFDR
jgi:FkbM family methyltransferase